MIEAKRVKNFSKPVSISSALSSDTVIDSVRIVEHTMALRFDQWLERPFIKHFYSLQNSCLNWNNSAHFFSFNEKDMQGFFPMGKKEKPGSKSHSPLKKLKCASRKRITENFNSDKNFSDIFRRCQDGDAEMLAGFGEQMVRRCEHLFILAEEGNGSAARFLAEIAIMATKGLEQVIPQHLESLKDLAVYEYAWPLMTSPIISLSSTLPDCEVLGLGVAFNLKFDPKKRLKLDTPVGRFAWQLLNYVVNLKRNCAKQIRTGVKHSDKNGNFSVEHLALELPALSNDSVVVEKWWEVAKRCLVEAFPSLNDHLALNEKHPRLERLVTARSHKKTARKHRAHILEKLYEQFRSIAGVSRYSGKKSKTA